MASGSDITATGMQTMTQVVASTDLVSATDFNNMQENIGRLLGNAQDITLGSGTSGSTYGWSQGGAGVADATTGNTITRTGAGGFKDLQDDVQAMCAFLGVSLRAGVGADVGTTTTISATTWNNTMLNIRDCWNSRFTPSSLTVSTPNNTFYSSAWGGLVNENNHGSTAMNPETLTQVTTWSFTSEANCRAFFNMGGRLGVSASRTGGSSTDQNTQWSTKLSNLGDVYINASTAGAGAGSPSGVGFYDLTTSDQQIVIYYGGANPYSNDYIQVKARVNSTTNPTQVIITTVMRDEDDNNSDASVDGTMTINARRWYPDANGSGFTPPIATPSMSTITAS